MNEDIAKEVQSALERDFPNAPKLKHTPNGPGGGEGKPPATTVSQDIDSLKAKLTVIARAIEMLKSQL